VIFLVVVGALGVLCVLRFAATRNQKAKTGKSSNLGNRNKESKSSKALKLIKKGLQKKSDTQEVVDDKELDDGSFAFTVMKMKPLPTRATTKKVKTSLAVADLSVTTTVITEGEVTTIVKTVAKPSNKIFSLFLKLKKAQIKIKTFSSFFQISLNISFNCAVTFPATFTRVLTSFKVLNLDLVPSLGLQCSFLGFDYIDSLLGQTVAPLVLAFLLLFAYAIANSSEQQKVKKLLLERADAFKPDVPQKLADCFSPKEFDLLKITFVEFDSDSGGTISKDELGEALLKYSADGFAKPEDVERIVNELFEEANDDGDEVIDFVEFLGMIHQSRHRGVDSAFSGLADKVEASISRKSGQLIFYSFLFLTFLVLVGTSTKLFHFFKCDSFPEADGGEQRYLFKDYSVDCNSYKYRATVLFVVLMIFVFPVGIPLMYLLLLRGHHSTLIDPEAMAWEEANDLPTIGHLEFLTVAYDPDMYW
jgi:hypothetical protein